MQRASSPLDMQSTPAYSKNLIEQLVATTPSRNGRYDKSTEILASDIDIPSGLFITSETQQITEPPRYEAAKWQTFIHPEGAKYFYRGKSDGLNVVTDANIHNSAVLDRMNNWIMAIENALRAKEIEFYSSQVELFLEPQEDLELCGYYLVNHASRTEFWLEQVNSEFLDLGLVVSTSHLKTAFEVQYWDHVQYYPMHNSACVTQEILDELLAVLSHGMTDRITSITSTFPYTVDECDKYIKLIKLARKQPFNGHFTWAVGRIWYNIVHSRFYTHFGEDMVKLNRDQSLYDAASVEDHNALKVAESLCFGLPEKHLSRFNTVFVDGMVERWDFRNLISDCLEEWKSSLLWSLPLLVSDLLFSFAPSASLVLSLSSAMLSALGALTAAMLTTKYQNSRDATATQGYLLMNALKSEKYGLKPAALVFSLPRTLLFWSFGLFLLQAVVLMHKLVNSWVALVWMAIAILVISCTAHVLSDSDESPCSWLFHSLQKASKVFSRKSKNESEDNFSNPECIV